MVNSKQCECISVGVVLFACFIFLLVVFLIILKDSFLLEKHCFVVLPSPSLLFHVGLPRMLNYANPWQQEGKGFLNFLVL